MFFMDSCSWKVFTGNELAALLGWWMLYNWKEAHPDPADTERVYMLATTVSSKILNAFARIEGFHFEVSSSLNLKFVLYQGLKYFECFIILK